MSGFLCQACATLLPELPFSQSTIMPAPSIQDAFDALEELDRKRPKHRSARVCEACRKGKRACNWTKDIDRCDRCAKHKILCAVAAESSGTGTGGYRRSASRQSTAPPAVQTVPSSSQSTMPHEVHVLNTHPPLSLRTAWPGVNPDDTFVFPNNLPGDDSANMPTDAGFSQYLSKASPPGAGGFSPSSLSQAAHAPSLGHPGYHISEGYLDTHTGSPAPYILGDPTLQTVQQYAYPHLLHNGSHPHNGGNEHVSRSSGYVSNSQPPAQSPSYAGMYHQQSQYLFDARPPPSN